LKEWKEGCFRTTDGLMLFYRYKEPKQKTRNALLFLHRGHEHSARIMPLADQISQDNYWCFGFDLRGHGLSEGERAWATGFDVWVKDLNNFSGHIRQAYGIRTQDSLLIANSVGCVTAISWILNYGPNLKGCIFAAPAFSIKLYIPFALSFLRLASKFSNRLFVTSYVRSQLLTRDKSQALMYDNDKLITKKIGVNILITLFDSVKNSFNRLKDFETPILLFTARKDYIVDNKLHTVFIEGISSTTKEHIKLADFKHAIFHEMEQEKVISPCIRFIKTQFCEKAMQLPAVIPEPRPHTVAEHKKLTEKGSLAEQVYYAGYRLLLKKIGKFSYGVLTGLKYGFDSGVSLDYIYCNTTTGDNWLGKLIDKFYLNSVGWRGIRTRKVNLKKTLIEVLKLLNAKNIEPVIFDIASGPGRYLFEAQKEMPFPVHLILNDSDINSLNRAKEIAKEFNALNARFTHHDAFSLNEDLDVTDTPPNIIIVSGLFELYENNLQVHRAISQLYKILNTGGFLIYTGQPWHPQINIIGRILNNRNGDRWIMRRRVQQEIDLLVESTGFSKLNTTTDGQGIFTVSCAQKMNGKI